MSLTHRVFSCAALLGAALAGLSQYRPAWAENTGLDWWNLPALHEQMCADQLWRADAERRDEVVLARMEVKRRLTDELCAGRLTLAQAAARFRDLDASKEPVVDSTALALLGNTPEERACRQVITWAAGAEVRRPADEQLRARLEAELRRLRDEGGGAVVLPD